MRCGICDAVVFRRTTRDNRHRQDCGGDCLVCMAHSGDVDAQQALAEWLANLRGAVSTSKRRKRRDDV